MSYATNRRKHLEKYADDTLPVGGKWQGKGEHPHILQFEESENDTQRRKNKYDVVCKYNLLEGVGRDLFLIKTMHRFAHHLNSSQVLCYNFFRPLVKLEEGYKYATPTEDLVSLLNSWGITITKEAHCYFEYNDKKGDGTQFDFYIKDSAVEVFFEIKYTEYGFGKADDDKKHREKFEGIYKTLLKEQKCLKQIPGKCEDFVGDYQLYRNSIRLTSKNQFLVLLYPAKNSRAESEADLFIKKNINDDYKDNIKCIHWEDIVPQDSELYKKYLAEE